MRSSISRILCVLSVIFFLLTDFSRGEGIVEIPEDYEPDALTVPCADAAGTSTCDAAITGLRIGTSTFADPLEAVAGKSQCNSPLIPWASSFAKKSADDSDAPAEVKQKQELLEDAIKSSDFTGASDIIGKVECWSCTQKVLLWHICKLSCKACSLEPATVGELCANDLSRVDRNEIAYCSAEVSKHSRRPDRDYENADEYDGAATSGSCVFLIGLAVMLHFLALRNS